MSSWYERNRERAIEYQKKYNQEHREHYISYQGAYYHTILKYEREPEPKPEPKSKPGRPPKIKKTPKPKPKPAPITNRKRTYIPYEPKIMITTGNYILTFD
jgi:hypothetical protein